jgi:hypothetical protein
MQAIKGIYKDGKIELLESLGKIQSADLYIVVIPHTEGKLNYGTIQEIFKSRTIQSEEEFKQVGLAHFFDTDDDADVDWEEVFGLEDR